MYLCSNDRVSCRRFSRTLAMRVGSVCLVGLALLTAVSAVACSDSQAVQPQQNAPPPPAVPITATAVVSKDMPLEVNVIGAVEAYATVAVRAQPGTGELTSVNFQAGDERSVRTRSRSRSIAGRWRPRSDKPPRPRTRYRPGRDTRAIMQRYEELVQRQHRRPRAAPIRPVRSWPPSSRQWRRMPPPSRTPRCRLQHVTIRAPIRAGRRCRWSTSELLGARNWIRCRSSPSIR